MTCLDVSRMGFKHVGENVRIFPGAKIIGCEHIHIGSNVIIDDFVLIYATAPVYIGSYVHIASFTSISGGSVVLEDFAGLSSGVRIIAGSEDFLGGGLTNPTVPAKYRPVQRSVVHIGRHVIIGANSSVMPGVHVGEGTAVGANSLVGRSLEPWGVYLGNPVRRLKERESETILRLERELMAERPFEPLVPPDMRALYG
ncbi:galactoside O-acetyltransferase [Pseudomonas knackmussii B13]|uniref:Chloramphenicol acetyltransferase n=1 Tax=Pseudomonas knackmussii (strain DSM 6978 / CCUG 54928 / LMG 23759 / B13) TaxID=1301098 RepID=A0A024HHB3_PSEKB|nr:acyltransferase [Pseudomonas knackmussii]CDF83892.1 galactoside O-acetyltransferase [Pseudomonas knackmussii B13]